IVNRSKNNLRSTLGLNATAAQQTDIPQRIGPRALLSEARVLLQSVHSRRALFQIAGCDIHLDCRRPNSEIVRVKPSHEQIVQPVIELDLAPPAFHAFGDLIVRSPIVVDRALQQQLSLTLRRSINHYRGANDQIAERVESWRRSDRSLPDSG